MSFKKIFLKVVLTLVAVISFATGALASDTADADCVFDESLLSREIYRFTSRDPEVFVVNKSIQKGNHPLMWEALKCLNDLMDKYPNVTSAIRWLKRYHGYKLGKTFEVTLEHMVKDPADKYWAISGVRGNFEAMVLNDIFWGQGFNERIKEASLNKDAFYDCCKRDVTSGFWCYCEEKDYIKRIISHEFGHVVEMVFACLVKYDDSRPEYAEYHGKSFDEICDLVRKKVVYNAAERIAKYKHEHDLKNGATVTQEVVPYSEFYFKISPDGTYTPPNDFNDPSSRYCIHYFFANMLYDNIPICAKYNPQEFFAELFSFYNTHDDLEEKPIPTGNIYIAAEYIVRDIVAPAIPDEHTTVVRGAISVWHWLTSWL